MSNNIGLVPMSAELTMFYHDFESSLAFAAQQERDRIIELLEENWTEPMDWLTVEALIKGEQK